MLLREAADRENAAIDQFHVEQHFLVEGGLGVQRQVDVELVVRKRIGVDVDVDRNAWSLVAAAQRVRRAGAFERQVLDVLCKHVERRLRTVSVGCSARRRFVVLGHQPYPLAWTVQARIEIGRWLPWPTGQDKVFRRLRADGSLAVEAAPGRIGIRLAVAP